MYKNFLSILLVLLSFTMIFTSCNVPSEPSDTDGSHPYFTTGGVLSGDTEPEDTEPEDTEPKDTEPKETDPEETEPETDSGDLEGEPVFILLDTLSELAELDTRIIVTSANKKIDLPSPTRELHNFEGWYRDPDFKVAFSEGDTVTENTTLYARWSFHTSAMEHMKNPVTVQYITFGGTISSLEYHSKALEADNSTSHPTPVRKDYKFEGWFYDSSYTQPVKGGLLYKDLVLYAKWTSLYYIEGMTLPVIAIKTDNGKDVRDRVNYMGCDVLVNDSNKETLLNHVRAQIRGRGNSTWTQFEKKSFRLKFDESTDLFGMGKAKNFLLISNAFDQSILRNYTAYTFAGLYGDEYTTKCQFVHLYVNDDYRGLYLVTEHTEVGKSRVNIGDVSGEGLDVGFLIEFGGEIDPGEKKYFLMDTVEYDKETINWGNKIGKIKSPDEYTCTDAQAEYIGNYINEVNRAILTHDFEKFKELCDLESFLDCFVINETLFPGDWGYNFFMYKPAGEKLFIGPLWDYDQSAGNSSHGGTAFDNWNTPSRHHWFRALRKTPEFLALARENYIENYELLHSLPDIIYGKYNEIVTDITLNYERWDVIGKPHWRSLPELVAFKTQKEHVDYYVTWLKNRMAWLEAEEQLNIKPEDLQ